MDNRDTQELSDRIEALEGKVDLLVAQMNKALGAWFFVKVLGSLAVGASIIWTFLVEHFMRK